MLNRSRGNSLEYRQFSVRFSNQVVLRALLLVAITGILTFSIIETSTVRAANPLLLLSFALNLIIGTALLVREIVIRPISLMQVHWIFYIVFFAIVPFSHYLQGYSPWGYVITEYMYLETNGLVFVWGVIFGFLTTRRKVYGDSGEANFHNALFDSLPDITQKAVLIMLAMSVIISALIINRVGLSNMFSRLTYSTGLDRTSELIFDKAIRCIPAFALAIAIISYKQHNTPAYVLLPITMLAIITTFPASLSRNATATIYGGIAVLWFRTLLNKKGTFAILLLIALLVAFPAINVFRTQAFQLQTLIESTISVIRTMSKGFCTGDYDAYSMLLRTNYYVRDCGSTMGYQLLTALLFFIPRSIWPAKSTGSGGIVGIAQHQSFVNISCPLPAEGIINFGIIGLITFCIITAILCNFLDKSFYNYSESKTNRAFYPFLCMLFFFIMRGDMLSSWAYMMGYTISFNILYNICRLPFFSK